MKSKKIAILGGGLCGRLLAWRLASTDKRKVSANKDQCTKIDNGIITSGIANTTNIHVFEKGSINPDLSNQHKASAFTAAAMISPSSELVSSELEIFKLGQKSLELWPAWLSQIDCLKHFHQQGSLVIAHPNDASELKQFEQDLGFKLKQLGNDIPQYQRLNNQQDLAIVEPCISKNFHQGLFLKNEAHIDSHPVLFKLVEAAEALGVQFHNDHTIDIDDLELAEFDVIFDCRGIGSKFSPLHQEDTLRGVRGEVIWLESKEITLTRPIRMMHPRYKLYVVPKPNNQFIIGATEVESEDLSPISLRSSMELMSALYAINPAFSEARIIRQDQNLRPAYLNNLPKIQFGKSKIRQPVISINGLYRHGYLIGPAIVEQAIEKAYL